MGLYFCHLKRKEHGEKQEWDIRINLEKNIAVPWYLIIDRLHHPSYASEYPRWVVSIYGIIKDAHEQFLTASFMAPYESLDDVDVWKTNSR